jgi:hypothetical protein
MTNAQLLKRWLAGESFADIAYHLGWHVKRAENGVRKAIAARLKETRKP